MWPSLSRPFGDHQADLAPVMSEEELAESIPMGGGAVHPLRRRDVNIAYQFSGTNLAGDGNMDVLLVAPRRTRSTTTPRW